MTTFENFALENGFSLKLGRWNFIYTENNKKLTIPVEMLMKGEYLWDISKKNIKTWDPPFNEEKIDPITISKILKRIEHFVELTGKKILIIEQEKRPYSLNFKY